MGVETAGSWQLWFDGSDVGLNSSRSEDVYGAWLDVNGDIYLTARGEFDMTGVSGDGADVFLCSPNSTGPDTSCNASMFWDGSAHGYEGETADGLYIDNTGMTGRLTVEVTSDFDARDGDDVAGGEDGDEDVFETDEGTNRLYLPVVTR